MYDLIDAKRSTRKLYTESLIGRGDITLDEAEQILRDYQQELERAFTETREATAPAGRAWIGGRQAAAEPAPVDHTRGADGDHRRRPSSGSSTPS